jgi:hypothetical protein
MVDNIILRDLKNQMNSLIVKKLDININVFEKTKAEHYRSSYYPYLVKTFINNQYELAYKYFSFGCSLIEKEIEILTNKQLKINIIRVFNQITNENKLILILYEASKLTIDSIPKSKYGIEIEVKNIIIPDNITNKTTIRLINENLNMTIEDFNRTQLDFLPIKHRNIKNIKNDNEVYKTFVVKCFFIELYLLKSIPEIKKYYSSFERRIFEDYETNDKNYSIIGIKQILCCHLVNAPDYIVKLIPTEILNVKLMIVNNKNITTSSNFKLGEHIFDENTISINSNIKSEQNMINYLYSKFNKNKILNQNIFSNNTNKLEIIFNLKKEYNEKYEVKELGDTILCTIIKYHRFNGYDADISNKKIIILKNNIQKYKKLLFKKIHLIE